MYTARNFLLILATIISLSVAYYFLFALPAHNRKMLQLEREKIEAAQKAKEEKEQERKIREEEQWAEQARKRQSKEFNEFVNRSEAQERERSERIEAEDKRNEAEARERIRQRNLEHCLQAAEKRYWDYIKLNGTPVPYKGDTYTAPKHIWDSARQNKKDAVDECYRTWGHR